MKWLSKPGHRDALDDTSEEGKQNWLALYNLIEVKHATS